MQSGCKPESNARASNLPRRGSYWKGDALDLLGGLRRAKAVREFHWRGQAGPSEWLGRFLLDPPSHVAPILTSAVSLFKNRNEYLEFLVGDSGGHDAGKHSSVGCQFVLPLPSRCEILECPCPLAGKQLWQLVLRDRKSEWTGHVKGAAPMVNALADGWHCTRVATRRANLNKHRKK